MRKLALHLEDLSVESFTTSEAETLRGTAHGQMMIVTQPDDTVGPPCTGESCRQICSYQICPMEPVAGSDGYALAAMPPRPSGATPCFTWQDTVCNCA